MNGQLCITNGNTAFYYNKSTTRYKFIFYDQYYDNVLFINYEEVEIMLQRLLHGLGTMVAGLAVAVTSMNINATCMMLIHQPKMPEGARKLKQQLTNGIR